MGAVWGGGAGSTCQNNLFIRVITRGVAAAAARCDETTLGRLINWSSGLPGSAAAAPVASAAAGGAACLVCAISLLV